MDLEVQRAGIWGAFKQVFVVNVAYKCSAKSVYHSILRMCTFLGHLV